MHLSVVTVTGARIVTLDIGQGRRMSSVGKSVILEEDIDPNYVPTREEIVDYAQFLGMELPRDEPLLWIATEGLKAPLPSMWKTCRSADGEQYYFNFSTGESTWEHPCDQFYRNLYEKEKQRLQGASDDGASRLTRSKPLLPIKVPSIDKKQPHPGKLATLKTEPPKESPVQPPPQEPKPTDIDRQLREKSAQWMQTEKARLEGERADWLERRRQEAEHWQAAKAAEIEADKQRKVQALLNDEVAAIEREADASAKRLEQHRVKMAEQAKALEAEMEEQRRKAAAALRDEVAKREATTRERLADLDAAHQANIERLRRQWRQELDALEQEHVDQVRIRNEAHAARVAELDLQADQLERDAEADRARRQADWNDRVLAVERDGQERVRREDAKWAQKREREQAAADGELQTRVDELQTRVGELQRELTEARAQQQATLEQMRRLRAEHDDLAARHAAVQDANTRLKERVGAHGNDHAVVADLNRQLTELEALYEGTCTQLEKAVAERDAAVKALADHDARPQIASAPADDTSSEDDEFDDALSSDVSEVSDSGVDTWSRHLGKESQHLQSAIAYLARQRAYICKARTALVRDQERWKRDRRAAPTGVADHDLERDLKRRKRFLDMRMKRLNAEIGQYRALKRGLTSRRERLRELQDNAQNVPSARNEAERREASPENVQVVDTPKTWQEVPFVAPARETTTARAAFRDVEPAEGGTRAALHNHYGWLKSFRNEIHRAAAASIAEGMPSPRYVSSAARMLTPAATANGNDITIRIKVEQ